MTLCSIVPPYILKALAQDGEPRVAQAASFTLQADARERQARALPVTPALNPETWGSAPAAVQAPTRRIFDAENGTALPGRHARAEGSDPVSDAAVNTVFENLGLALSFWEKAYGRNSLDDKGLPLTASIHYGRDYDNAFWDGRQMVFGDGDQVVFSGFVGSVDVLAHELAHGVTQYTAGLNYRGQSGALNEHLSDVFGVLTGQFVAGHSATAASWLVGEGVLAAGIQGRGLRSLQQPGSAYDDPRLGGRDPQPGHMSEYVQTEDDNEGVHLNSGIPNHAFYLAATQIGGFAWEGAGQIWYDVLTGDISADCDFERFAQLTISAAVMRHGAGSPQEAAVRSAWEQVGVAVTEGGTSTGADAGQGSATPGTVADQTVPDQAAVAQALAAELPAEAEVAEQASEVQTVGEQAPGGGELPEGEAAPVMEAVPEWAMVRQEAQVQEAPQQETDLEPGPAEQTSPEAYTCSPQPRAVPPGAPQPPHDQPSDLHDLVAAAFGAPLSEQAVPSRWAVDQRGGDGQGIGLDGGELGQLEGADSEELAPTGPRPAVTKLAPVNLLGAVPRGPGLTSPLGRVQLRRSGGLAGLLHENVIEVPALDEPLSSRWRSFLVSPRARELAAQGERNTPDAFAYTVRCALPKVDLQVSERQLTDDERDLFDRALGLIQPEPSEEAAEPAAEPSDEGTEPNDEASDVDLPDSEPSQGEGDLT